MKYQTKLLSSHSLVILSRPTWLGRRASGGNEIISILPLLIRTSIYDTDHDNDHNGGGGGGDDDD
jgi:hypothetical protein